MVDTLRVSRNSAQSAATKAVQQERPFNLARITRRRPGISCVDTRLRNRMLRMSKAGKTQKEIAAKLDLCVRRSEEHKYELQSLMRNSYAVFCLKTKNNKL